MNWLDKTIGFVNPKAGARRLQHRASMLAMDTQVRRYEGAAEGSRHSNWLTRNNPSVNQVINRDLKKLVSRSRELILNNPYARKAPISIANNVVGTGIMPTPTILDTIKNGRVVKGKNKEQTLQALQLAWQLWGESLACDFNGDFNFFGLQYLAMRTIWASGEVLAIRKRVETKINKYGVQILLLEGDYIDISKNNEKDADGGYTSYGIKFDSNLKKVGYWIYDKHPSEGNAKSSLIGIENIIHVYDVERSGQGRGVPASSSALLKQRDLDDYEDAELLAKKISACMPIFIQNADPEKNVGAGLVGNEKIEEIQPGQINYLNGNETVSFATPPSNNGFDAFTRTQHRGVAAANLMPYELFTGDLSNVNFSSGRMGNIEFYKSVEYLQYLMFIPRFCEKAYQWFIDGFKLVEGIDNDVVIKAKWTAPRREMIDPLKEISAQRLAVRAGFTSWQEVVKQNGYKPEDVLRELKEAQDLFEAGKQMPDWTQYFEKKALMEMQQAAIANAAKPKEKPTEQVK